MNEPAWSPPETTRELLVEGRLLARLFFGQSEWCHRRVMTLRFTAQRRGDWAVAVDFHVTPNLLLSPWLTDEGEVHVPLFTFLKDAMPQTRVRTEDEQGKNVPLLASRRSRTIAYLILTALAQRAKVDSLEPEILAKLTDSDIRTSGAAFKALEGALRQESAEGAIWQPGAPLRRQLADFVHAARLFHRSRIVLASLPLADARHNRHKIVVFTYDAPIRLTMKVPELCGYSPLRVAPLTIFGGDAGSYHVQFDPPPGVVVVDTRLFYSYTDTQGHFDKPPHPEDFADRRLYDRGSRPAVARTLLRLGLPPPGHVQPACPRPFPKEAADSGWLRWWGFVEGSAEPMYPHVRISRRRMPRLIDGRDAVSMFQLYPDMTAYFGLLLAACANLGYTLAVFIEFLEKGRIPGWKEHPEPVFILGVLIAGLGSGLALYKRDHIITVQAARPWRWLFGAQVAAVVSIMVVLLISMGHKLMPERQLYAIYAIAALAMLAFVYLVVISARAWFAQTAGFRPLYGWQGFAPRRRRFKYRWRPDEPNTRRAPPAGSTLIASLKEPKVSEFGRKRTEWFMSYFAECYLNEGVRRDLFNRGIPAASRHDPASRGSSELVRIPAMTIALWWIRSSLAAIRRAMAANDNDPTA